MNKGKKYKLIVLDVDGTLLDSKGELSEYTERALRTFMGYGGYVLLATGKLFRTIESLCKILSLKTKQIIANGSVVVDPTTGVHETIHALDLYSLKKLCRILKDHRVEFVYYKNKRIFYEPGAGSYVHLKGLVREGELFPQFLTDYSSWDSNGVVKVLSFVTKEDEELEKRIRKKTIDICPNIRVIRSSPHYLEYIHKNASKLEALLRILEDLSINLKEIVAFGDSESDLEMIKKSGIGVAMNNASLTVKKAADYLTKSNNCDGVAHFIYHFLLENTF